MMDSEQEAASAETEAPIEGEAAPEAPAESAKGPRTNRFRKRFTTDRLAPDKVERQGKIARIAFEVLGRDGATAFLNTHDEELGGRPLDLAMESAEGMKTIEAAIAARKG